MQLVNKQSTLKYANKVTGKHPHFTSVSASLDKRFLEVAEAPFQLHLELDQLFLVETKGQRM